MKVGNAFGTHCTLYKLSSGYESKPSADFGSLLSEARQSDYWTRLDDYPNLMMTCSPLRLMHVEFIFRSRGPLPRLKFTASHGNLTCQALRHKHRDDNRWTCDSYSKTDDTVIGRRLRLILDGSADSESCAQLFWWSKKIDGSPVCSLKPSG
jgi:hypothetical protein